MRILLSLASILFSVIPAQSSESSPTPAAVHWSFQPVERPHPPAVRQTGWARTDLDRFILARLESANLTPSPEADRSTLIRRLYLVMLGVPPSPEDVAAFVDDPRPDAFERLVDRVLDDPRYGERWARHWLDVIRFAESNGFETNRERPNAWRFRDYVIEAFNSDLPYDRFVREQLAGDTLGADVATGYLVAGPKDIVGSPDPVLTAQQRADELDDMVGTTGTAFLGLTLACARCHTHKFDPIEQTEYYSMAALFDGVQHGERALPDTPVRQERLASLDAHIAGLEQRLAPFLPKADTRQASAASTSRRPAVNARRNEDILEPVTARFLRFTILASNSGEPCLDELEVWSGTTNVALATRGTTATASSTLPGYEIHKLEHLNDGRTGNARSWISNEPGGGWVQLEFMQPERLERVVWGRDREGQFKDRVAKRYRIETALTPGKWTLAASSEDREPFQESREQPAPPEYRFDGFAEAEAARGRQWLAELRRARKERDALGKAPMAYAGTFGKPGATHRLHRGDPMQKRELIPPGTPAVFRPLTLSTNTPDSDRRRRLAEWITRPDHPLTARVMVNRVWQHHFGSGLVDTPNDFGKNGARPTHPGLLDWLADEFVANGWRLKPLHRILLTSATWRQAATPRPEAIAVDADTRLLWRFPSRRLEAEAIRDAVLTVSGSLRPSSGGPGFYLHDIDRENVYHYHPKESFGEEDFRRMIYAVKIRMEQDAIFGAFDCPDGSLAVGRRSVSTTPLQALNLFNSRFILDQAGRLARRLDREAGEDPAARVDLAWRLAFGRPPGAEEAIEARQLAAGHGWPALGRALFNANEFLFIP